MLTCFISDIHGNKVAFDQCLEHLANIVPDQVFFLGDAVGYFPEGEAVLEQLNNSRIKCQLGNHEKMLFDGPPAEKDDVYMLGSLRDQINPVTLSLVRKWPGRREIKIEGKTFLLVHGSPNGDLDDYVYPDDDLTSLTSNSHDAIFMGHTHHPFIQELQGKLLVNTGSVGLPRDHGQLASMAIYDSSTGQGKILRFQIDTKKILDRYGSSIHESVASCLQRKTDNFIGEIIT